MSDGLDGLVVLEIAQTPGAAFAVAMLADFGADAIICEPLGGARLRSLGFGELDDIRWQVLARNKQSIALDWTRPEAAETMRALLRRADLLVTDLAEPDRRANPWFGVVEGLPDAERPLVVAIFPTGADLPDLWPWSRRPEFAAAASGVMALTGHTGKTPIQAEAPLADYLSGALAAARALMALRAAHLTGRPAAAISTPLHLALHRMIEWQMPVATALGRAETRMGNNFPMNAGIANMHPTGDGKYVAISAVTQATAVRLMTMVGGPDLAADPRFATQEARSRGLVELYARIDAWTGLRSTAEILKIAAAHDVVLGPIYTTDDIFKHEQIRARDNIVMVPAPGGGVIAMPSIVPEISGFDRQIRRAGPAIGADTKSILAEVGSGAGHRARPATAEQRGRGGPPHSGLPGSRNKLLVIELGAVIAGPFAGSLLAELGGTVIKIESPEAGDSLRKMGPAKDGAPLWFGTSAREKQCVTLNLKQPEGKALFLRLIGMADVLVENFRPGVLERLGLGWDTLRAANPRLIMLSISGFGQTGPQSSRPGFGKIAEGLSGIVSLTGEAGKPPLYVGFSLADASAGLFGVHGVAVALYCRDVLGGSGARIDLALYEPLMRMLDCQLALHARDGVPPERGGTNDPYGFGRASESRPRFRSVESASGRWYLLAVAEAQAEAADLLIARASTLDDAALEDALFAAGIEFCPVFDGMTIASSPYFQARGDVISQNHPVVGPISAPGPLHGGAAPAFHPPALGEANAEIFGGLLGLTGPERARLKADGVI